MPSPANLLTNPDFELPIAPDVAIPVGGWGYVPGGPQPGRFATVERSTAWSMSGTHSLHVITTLSDPETDFMAINPDTWTDDSTLGSGLWPVTPGDEFVLWADFNVIHVDQDNSGIGFQVYFWDASFTHLYFATAGNPPDGVTERSWFPFQVPHGGSINYVWMAPGIYTYNDTGQDSEFHLDRAYLAKSVATPKTPQKILFEPLRYDPHPGVNEGDALAIENTDGTEPSADLVTHTGSQAVGGARFSPDRTRIAYTWEEAGFSGTTKLRLIPLMGGTPTDTYVPPSDTQLALLAPAWSPDSARIAFVQYVEISPPATSPLKTQLCAINADGTGLAVLWDSGVEVINPGDGPHWSPDGSHILFSQGLGDFADSHRKICRINPDGTGLADITDGTTDDWLIGVTHAGDRLLTIREVHGTGSENDTWVLATMATDGTGFALIVSDPGENYLPDSGYAFSPDDSLIVFAPRGFGAGVGASLMNPDGTNVHQLRPLASVYIGEGGTDWSTTFPVPSDSGKIVFERQTYDSDGIDPPGVTNEIWTVNLDGTELTQLTSDSNPVGTGGPWNETPSYSPEGQRILWWKYGSGYDQIWIMNADGSSQTMVHDSPGDDYFIYEPFLSPDGLTVLFAGYDPGGTNSYHVRTVPLAGGVSVDLVDSGSSNSAYARWSPDGSHIAYVVNEQDLHTMLPDGTGDVLVGSAHELRLQAWTSTGFLVVTRDNDTDPRYVAIMDAGGTITPTTITSTSAALDFFDGPSGTFNTPGRSVWLTSTGVVAYPLRAGGDDTQANLIESFEDGNGLPRNVT